MNDIVKILLGIVTLAMVAVVLSNKSNTATILGKFFKGFDGSISAAEQG